MSVPQWNADIITPEEEGSGTKVLDGNQVVQPTLEGGTNITISDGTISATGGGAEYYAGEGIVISNENAISITETVRDGAALGATSVQPADLSGYVLASSLATVATSGDYDDLSNKPNIPNYTAGNGIAISGQNVISSNTSSSDFVYGQTSAIPSSNYNNNNSFWYPEDGDGRSAPSTIKCIRAIEIGFENYTLHWVTGTAGQAYVSTFSVDVRYGVTVGTILQLPKSNRSSDWVGGVTPIGVNPIYLTIAGSTGGTAPNGEEVVALRANASTPYFVAVENPTTMYLKNPLPASSVADADKVLKVNSSGTAEWATGGAQADWTEADPSDPSYVQNKPEVLGILAGSGITITESASTILIATEIPSYNTTTDVGKVLQVTANGLSWVTLS